VREERASSNKMTSLRKNKRKSLEPRRLGGPWLLPSPEPATGGTLPPPPQTGANAGEGNDGGAAPAGRCRLNSTGSEERSPTTTEYTSDSRTPSPALLPHAVAGLLELGKRDFSSSVSCLAPKKRFKFDALRDLERSQTEEMSSPFHQPRDKNVAPSPEKPPSPTAGNASPLPMPAYLPFLLPGLVVVGDSKIIHQQMSLLPLHPRLFSFPVGDVPSPPPVQEEPLSLVVKDKKARSRETYSGGSGPKKASLKRYETTALRATGPSSEPAQRKRKLVKSKLKSEPVQKKEQAVMSDEDEMEEQGGGHRSSLENEPVRGQQRNYKNLTRERRVEANARERQRVHTITAAFDTLQAAIPSEEENAKLSKLSVIKIATAYIMALSRMAGYDYTEDQSAPSLETVVQHCQEVIHTETRIKKRSANS
jgi:hypothetical protein